MEAGKLSLRPARGDDAALLLEWRNDPEVQSVSRNSGEIAGPEHQAWLDEVLADPERHLLIAEIDREPVGQVRFDPRAGDLHEISVSVAAAHRGRGLGKRLIESGASWLVERQPETAIEAYVLADNARSLKAFEGAGFERAGSDETGRMARLVLSPSRP